MLLALINLNGCVPCSTGLRRFAATKQPTTLLLFSHKCDAATYIIHDMHSLTILSSHYNIVAGVHVQSTFNSQFLAMYSC